MLAFEKNLAHILQVALIQADLDYSCTELSLIIAYADLY